MDNQSPSRSSSKNDSRSDFQPVFLKLAPKNIVYLKGILESYDELGVLRTLDAKTGEVVILAISDLKPDLDQLIEALKGEIELEIQSCPAKWSERDENLGDWLLDGPL
jgi:hypothetical protein